MADNKNNKLKNFQKRFEQKAKLELLRNSKLRDEIVDIRSKIDLPEQGFNWDKREDWNLFKTWLLNQNGDNFKKIINIFSKSKEVKADPLTLLINIFYSIFVSDEGYPEGLYNWSNLKYFDAILQERPFPGIVHYIIWDKIFLPESQELQVATETINGRIYPVLRLGPNARIEDIKSWFPIINGLFQKQGNPSIYRKRLGRIKKNFERDLEVNKRNTYIHNGKEFVDTYSGVDILNRYDGKDGIINNENDKRQQANVRKIRQRTRERLGLKKIKK